MNSKHNGALGAVQPLWCSLLTSRWLPLCVLFLPSLAVYRSWLNGSIITSGDWPPFTNTYLRGYLPYPSAIDTVASLGEYDLLHIPFAPLYVVEGLFASMGWSFAVTERLIWYFPSVVTSLLCTYILLSVLLRHRWWPIVGAWLYTFNSYNLTLQDRGDIAMSAAHGLLPAILLLIMLYIEDVRFVSWRWGLLLGLLALQSWYEPRITYITLVICGIYCLWWLVAHFVHSVDLKRIVSRFVIRIGVLVAPLVLISLYWILPTYAVHQPILPSTSSGVGWVQPLSLATISDGLTLFDPLWPVDWYFLKFPIAPLFWLIPILITLYVVLVERLTVKVLSFTSMALLGIFLTKGSNAPVGSLYVWLFQHIPGFELFRDPLKFFHVIEIAYAFLFTMAVVFLYDHMSALHTIWLRRAARSLLIASGVIIVLYPVIPTLPRAAWAFANGLSPLSSQHIAWPQEYTKLNSLIENQPYARSLWLPSLMPFGGSSTQHPALGAVSFGQQYLPDVAGLQQMQWFSRSTTPQLMSLLSVRYVIVPDDVLQRTYSYLSPAHGAEWYVALCQRWLHGWKRFNVGKIVVFENPLTLPRVFIGTIPSDASSTLSLEQFPVSDRAAWTLPGGPTTLDLVKSTPTHVEVVTGLLTHPHLLVLGNEFSSFWHISIKQVSGVSLTHGQLAAIQFSHRRTNGYANGWLLPSGARYDIALDYYPQVIINWSALVSIASLAAFLIFAGLQSLLGLRVYQRLWSHSEPVLARRQADVG